MYIADLHIHSRYSRATSRDLTAETLELFGRKKGIGLIGTGDFTHPKWREELTESLEPAENGLYRLKAERQISGEYAGEAPRFVVTGEISSIYKQGGKVRKVHNVIMLPSLEAAELIAKKLETIGNIHSDGRPILGLSSRDLLEITMELCPEAIFVPAHIWTPHFAMFGAFSGFDTVEECFGDMTPYIHAVETGLSSDPPMNWRLSALDRYQLISNSDAHSPAKLGREGNLIEGALSYEGLYQAVQTGEGLYSTIEFFPEEGKYHYDGHRKCHLCLSPQEAAKYGGKCPVCGKKLTIGVEHRVEELADRPLGYVRENAKPFESLVPLQEVIAASLGCGAQSTKAVRLYEELLKTLGTEFAILREIPAEDIKKAAGGRLAEGIRRLRAGEVDRRPGYDGEYGSIRLFGEDELANADGQLDLFSALGIEKTAEQQEESAEIISDKIVSEEQNLKNSENDENNLKKVKPEKPGDSEKQKPQGFALSERQRKAAEFTGRAAAVIAGPGTGKTKTLIAHILHLVKERGVKPSEITAVTFTRKAAKELHERLAKEPELKRSLHFIQIGTFHSICLALLKRHGEQFVLAEDQAMREVLSEEQHSSQTKNKILDFDGLIAETLALLKREQKNEFRGKQFHYLLVDEFQDVSRDQYELVKAWNKGGKEIFVIGDPDQSIYGFRGSDAACFTRLAEEFPALCRMELSINYRSKPEIVRAAQNVIRKNEGEHCHVTAAEEAEKESEIRNISASSDLAEAIFIAKEINRMVGGIDMIDTETGFWGRAMEEQSRSFSEIAVLYRTNYQAELLERCLKKESIPYIVHGKEEFLSADSVRGTLAFFRYLAEGDMILKQLSAKLLWKLSKNQITEAVLQAAEEAYRPLLKRGAPKKVLEKWAEEMGLANDRAMKKLLSASLFYPSTEEMLAGLLLGSEGDFRRCGGKQFQAEAVSLMTLHAAKGLEFPVVMIYGANKGKIPLETAKGETDLSEERRLFYVGMTRAKEELIITSSGEASPFLEEIGEELLSRETAKAERRTEPDGQLSLFDEM